MDSYRCSPLICRVMVLVANAVIVKYAFRCHGAVTEAVGV